MNLLIDLVDETNNLTEKELQTIEQLLNFAAKEEKILKDYELSVTFVTNEQIQEINRDYRGKDQPTDVISFAMEEIGEGEMEIVGVEVPALLGDIIISIQRAREQAEEYGHSFIRELGFLAVHGFLHLLGYDHMNEEDEREMFSRQKDILSLFGLER